MLTYCITVDLGKIELMCKYRVCIEQLFDRNSLLHYLHRTCIGKINRNYPVTREVTGQGAQLVISVVPHYIRIYNKHITNHHITQSVANYLFRICKYMGRF